MRVAGHGSAWTLASGSLSATLATSIAIRAAKGMTAAPVRVVVVGNASRASTATRAALRKAATNT